jgi:hypothetical protein
MISLKCPIKYMGPGTLDVLLAKVLTRPKS